jgi:hypothetical protein
MATTKRSLPDDVTHDLRMYVSATVAIEELGFVGPIKNHVRSAYNEKPVGPKYYDEITEVVRNTNRRTPRPYPPTMMDPPKRWKQDFVPVSGYRDGRYVLELVLQAVGPVHVLETKEQIEGWNWDSEHTALVPLTELYNYERRKAKDALAKDGVRDEPTQSWRVIYVEDVPAEHPVGWQMEAASFSLLSTCHTWENLGPDVGAWACIHMGKVLNGTRHFCALVLAEIIMNGGAYRDI